MNILYTYYKKGKDKETDELFEKVLISNKYTHESFQIWHACLWVLLVRGGNNSVCFSRCSIVSNGIEMVQGWRMI